MTVSTNDADAIEVRLLTEADFDLVMRCDPDTFDDPPNAAATAAYLAAPQHAIVGAISGGVLIGFVSMGIYHHPDKDAPVLYLDEAGVSEKFHRRGVGARLMAAALAYGKEKGCSSAWVLTETDNDAARALYERAGGESRTVEYFEFDLEGGA